jgi:hypothetical protein
MDKILIVNTKLQAINLITEDGIVRLKKGSSVTIEEGKIDLQYVKRIGLNYVVTTVKNEEEIASSDTPSVVEKQEEKIKALKKKKKNKGEEELA